MIKHIFSTPEITEQLDLQLAIQKGYSPTIETKEEFKQKDSYPDNAIDVKSFTKMDKKVKYSYVIVTKKPNPQTTEHFWKDFFNKKFLHEHFLKPMLDIATKKQQQEIKEKQTKLDTIKKNIEKELVKQTL